MRTLGTIRTGIIHVSLLVVFLACGAVSYAAPHSDSKLPHGETEIVDFSTADSAEAVARKIVTQMAPTFVFHPDETIFPGDAEKFWSVEAFLCRAKPSSTYDANGKQWKPGKLVSDARLKGLPAQLDFSTADCFITAGKETTNPRLENAVCYCDVHVEGPFIQAKYWFWNSFNNHPNDFWFEFLSHEGDWEHVELRATRIENTAKFRYFFYANSHGHPSLVLPTQWDDGAKPWQHPKFWIAQGSHAVYDSPSSVGPFSLDPAEFSRILGRVSDRVADSNFRWQTWNSLKIREPKDASPVWTFEGEWGDAALTPFLSRNWVHCPSGPNTRARYANSNGDEVFP